MTEIGNENGEAITEGLSLETRIVPLTQTEIIISPIHPLPTTESSPAYEEYMRIRSRILDLIHEELDQDESVLEDIVDAICETKLNLTADIVYWAQIILTLGLQARKIRKERKILSKTIYSLLEQIFDPLLEFKMRHKDILDCLEANGYARDQVTDKLIGRIYVVILNKLRTGTFRRLVDEEPLLISYIRMKLMEIGDSRLNWEVNSR